MQKVGSPLVQNLRIRAIIFWRSSTYAVDLLYQMPRARKKKKMRLKDPHSLVIAKKLVL